MKPLTNPQETRSGWGSKNLTQSLPLRGPPCSANCPPSSPGRNRCRLQSYSARRKGNRSSPFVGYGLSAPSSPSEALRHGIALGAGPSHFPPPAPLLPKDQEFPPPGKGGRSAGLAAHPSPSRSKSGPPAGQRSAPSPCGWLPTPHLSWTRASAPRWGGSASPPPSPPLARRGQKDRDLLPTDTLPAPWGRGQKHSLHLHLQPPRPHWVGRTDLTPPLG